MDKGLVFYSLIDFYPRRDEIKECFDKLSIDERLNYRRYVFCLSFEEEYIEELIWDYLNGYEESMCELAKQYRKKKEKYERQRLKEKRLYGEVEEYDL